MIYLSNKMDYYEQEKYVNLDGNVSELLDVP